MKKLLLFCLIFSLALPLFAQEPEPGTRADNECFPGGSMTNMCGRDTDGDGVTTEAEIEWAWTCGWYVARYNDGLLSRAQMPARCVGLITPPPATACFTYGGSLYCLTGNLLTIDVGSNGSIEVEYLVISDNTSGNGGVCPPGTSYWGDVIDSDNGPDFYTQRGYVITDDWCRVGGGA